MYLTLSCDFVGVKGQPFRQQAIWTAGVLRAEQKRHKQDENGCGETTQNNQFSAQICREARGVEPMLV